jgi:hypothetical protein
MNTLIACWVECSVCGATNDRKNWNTRQAPAQELTEDLVIGAMELLHLAIYYNDPREELLIRSKEILRMLKSKPMAARS